MSVNQEDAKGYPRRAGVLRNAFFNYTSMAVGFLWALFMTPFILHTVGTEQYGIWLIVSSLMGYLGLSELGLTIALVRYIPRYLALNDAKAICETLSTMMAIFVASAGAVTVGGLIFAKYVGFFKIESEQLQLARIVILIMSLDLATGLILTPLTGAVRAMERFDVWNGPYIATTALRAAALAILLPRFPNIVTLCLATAIGTLASRLAITWFAIRALPRPFLSLSGARKSTARRLLGYTSWTLIVGLSRQMLHRTYSLIVSKFVGVAAAPRYFAAWRPIELITQANGAFVQVLAPRASRLEALGDMEAVRATLIKAARISYLIALSTGVTAMVYGREILSHWLGREFGDSVSYLRILMAPQIVIIANQMGSRFHFALGKHQKFAILWVVTGVLSIGLCVGLAPHYGLFGIAWGMSLPMALMAIANTWLICVNVQMPIIRYLSAVFFRPSLPIAAVAAGLVFLRSALNTESLLLIAVQCVGGAALIFLVGALSYGRSALSEYTDVIRRTFRRPA